MINLPDPLSVKPFIWKENTTGLSLLKSIGVERAKVKAAQNILDEKAEQSALKLIGGMVGSKWNTDNALYIQPKMDEIRKEFREDYYKYKGKLPMDKEIYYQNSVNDVKTLTLEANTTYSQWLAREAKLQSDTANKTTAGEQYDHTLSEENQDIHLDPAKWLKENPGNTRWKDVNADWMAAGKDKHKFNSDNWGKYDLVPLAKAITPFDYTQDKTKARINEIGSPTGVPGQTHDVRSYDETFNSTLATNKYYNGTVKGKKYSDEMPKLYQTGVENGTIYPDDKDHPENASADTWGIARIKEQMEANAGGLKDKTSAAHVFGGGSGSSKKDKDSDAVFVRQTINEGATIKVYDNINITPLATGKNNIINFSGVMGTNQTTGKKAVLSNRKLEISSIQIDPKTGVKTALLTEPVEYEKYDSNGNFTGYIKNPLANTSYRVDYNNVEGTIRAQFKHIAKLVDDYESQTTVPAATTPAAGTTKINISKYGGKVHKTK